MTGFLLRDVRIVPLEARRGRPRWSRSTCGSPTGSSPRSGPALPADAALEESAPSGRWLVPGLWDQHVHLGQWTPRLAASRPRAAPARSVRRSRSWPSGWRRLPTCPLVGWGHRPATWAEQPTVAALDELAGLRPVVLISGDGHHAWCNSVAMRGLGLAPREGMVSEGGVVRGVPPAGAAGRHRRALARRLPARDAAGRRPRRRGPGRPRVRPGRDRLARALRGRRRPAARARRGLRRHPRRLPRRGGAHRPGAARLRPAGHDGPAEGDLRRLAEHAYGVVLLPLPRRQHRRGQHQHGWAAGGDGGRQPAPPRRRDPRDRRRRGRPGALRLRVDRRARLDRARPADPARRRREDGPARRTRQCAAGAPARRPRR